MQPACVCQVQVADLHITLYKLTNRILPDHSGAGSKCRLDAGNITCPTQASRERCFGQSLRYQALDCSRLLVGLAVEATLMEAFWNFDVGVPTPSQDLLFFLGQKFSAA